MTREPTIPTVDILGIRDESSRIRCAHCVDVCAFDRGFVYSDSADRVACCASCGNPLTDAGEPTRCSDCGALWDNGAGCCAAHCHTWGDDLRPLPGAWWHAQAIAWSRAHATRAPESDGGR